MKPMTLLVGLMMLGLVHDALGTDLKSTPKFHPISVGKLVDGCKNMFQPPAKTAAAKVRRICERDFQKSNGDTCQVTLSATDAQYAKLTSSEIFQPLPSSSAAGLRTDVQTPENITTYAIRMNAVYQSSSGGTVQVHCDLKKFAQTPTDLVTPYEQRAPGVTDGLVSFVSPGQPGVNETTPAQ